MHIGRAIGVVCLMAFCLPAIHASPVVFGRGTATGLNYTLAQSAVRTYTAAGTLTDASRARLETSLRKVEGVDKLEIKAGRGRFTVRVTGSARPNALSMAAIAAGFDFRPTQTRTFAVTSAGAGSDMAALRAALEKIRGVEQVDTQGAGATATVRVQGDVKVDAIAAAAKAAGFELSRSINYVASGPADEEGIAKLKLAVENAAGVKRSDVKPIPGGATLTVEGTMDDDGLAESALAAGYTLKTLSSSAGVRMFIVSGVEGPDDEEKLRKAVQAVSGIGEFQVMTLGDMTRLGVRGGSASPENILAAAKAAGVDLQPAGGNRGQGGGSDAERNTPPAFDERVNDDVTKVGDPAPDFELIKSDGKSKVKLSTFQGKKPVVLIFGSYT